MPTDRDDTEPVRFQYRVDIGWAYTYCAHGIDVDFEVRRLLSRGVRPETIQVTVVEKERHGW